MTRLSELLAEAGIAPPPGAAGIDVGGVVYDSRHAAPGTLFVAVPGFHVDGHAYAAAAVAAGAVAVVAEHAPDPALPAETPLLLVPDSREALAHLAAAAAGFPSRRMTVAGITGTDGKTTTTTMLWAAWRGAGIPCGSLTTVDHRVLDDIVDNETRQTTLEAPELQERLVAMLEAGCTHAAVETSSHSLALHRVDGVDYDLAVYTRITSEHLELHGSHEAYVAAKARLLEMTAAGGGTAVLDADDPVGFPRLVQIDVARRLTYSLSGLPSADLVARDIDVSGGGVRFTAHTPWGTEPVALRVAGRFNAGNALAALAAACSSGASLRDAVRGLERLERVTGRMERVDLGQPFAVVVDYAHTEASLEKVLRELRPATAGRLWAVFGSAGERDTEKRPAMGAVAARLADVVVVTDEDPRGEDRDAILAEIAAGAEREGAARGDRLHVIADRSEAVRFAIRGAAAGDTVLLAGKGHEHSILMADGAHPWDERAAAEAAVRDRLAGG